MCTQKQITTADVRSLYPSCKRVAFVGQCTAWVQQLDGSIHIARLEYDGTLTRLAQPQWADFDEAVRLHLAAINGEDEEDEEDAPHVCDYCGGGDTCEDALWCADCDRCESECDCPPFCPHREWGTY